MGALVQVGGSQIGAGATADFSFTVMPLSPSQAVVASPSAPLDASWAGITWCAFRSAVNTLTIRLANVTAGAKTPVAQNFAIQALRDTSLN